MRTRTKITRSSPVAALELGFARLIDIAGSAVSHAYHHQAERNDAAAIAADWQNVGHDIRQACRKADQLGITR